MKKLSARGSLLDRRRLLAVVVVVVLAAAGCGGSDDAADEGEGTTTTTTTEPVSESSITTSTSTSTTSASTTTEPDPNGTTDEPSSQGGTKDTYCPLVTPLVTMDQATLFQAIAVGWDLYVENLPPDAPTSLHDATDALSASFETNDGQAAAKLGTFVSEAKAYCT